MAERSRRGSTAARLLGLRVRNPAGTRMSICCECCVLSGRGLCDGPITRKEESEEVCVCVCVCVCVSESDLGTSHMCLVSLGMSIYEKN